MKMRTGKEVEVVEGGVGRRGIFELKDINDNMELEGEVVCEEVKLGIKIRGFFGEFRW